MAYTGNSPSESTVLRLEARKSFAFSVHITDDRGRPLDITDAGLRMVMKKEPLDNLDTADMKNLIQNSDAEIVDGPAGIFRFNLQASELNHLPGEYPYAMVLYYQGYSSVIVKGVTELEANTEFLSMNQTYNDDGNVSALTVALRGMNVVSTRVGGALAPGVTSFTDEDKRKLDTIEEGAQVNVQIDYLAADDAPGSIANKPNLGTAAFKNVEDLSVPPGGAPGEVLAKLSSTDFHTGWVQQTGGGGSGLDATGVTAGWVPTANGADGWGWKEVKAGVTKVNGKIGDVTLTLADIADSLPRVAMTQTERLKLDGLTATPDWTDVQNKPVFGTAAYSNAADFLTSDSTIHAEQVEQLPNDKVPALTELRGFSSGTTPPAGGQDGDLYFQYQ